MNLKFIVCFVSLCQLCFGYQRTHFIAFVWVTVYFISHSIANSIHYETRIIFDLHWTPIWLCWLLLMETRFISFFVCNQYHDNCLFIVTWCKWRLCNGNMGNIFFMCCELSFQTSTFCCAHCSVDVDPFRNNFGDITSLFNLPTAWIVFVLHCFVRLLYFQ